MTLRAASQRNRAIADTPIRRHADTLLPGSWILAPILVLLVLLELLELLELVELLSFPFAIRNALLAILSWLGSLLPT